MDKEKLAKQLYDDWDDKITNHEPFLPDEQGKQWQYVHDTYKTLHRNWVQRFIIEPSAMEKIDLLYKIIGEVTLVDLKVGELVAFQLRDLRKELEREVMCEVR